jgi:hypothetical protein
MLKGEGYMNSQSGRHATVVVDHERFIPTLLFPCAKNFFGPLSIAKDVTAGKLIYERWFLLFSMMLSHDTKTREYIEFSLHYSIADLFATVCSSKPFSASRHSFILYFDGVECLLSSCRANIMDYQ